MVLFQVSPSAVRCLVHGGSVLTFFTFHAESSKGSENRDIPERPFKVLNAPELKDDFYCSLLAYSPNCQTLAVGLGNLLYAWSEQGGVELLSVTRTRDHV